MARRRDKWDGNRTDKDVVDKDSVQSDFIGNQVEGVKLGELTANVTQ
jgi:hypothetical protein